MNTLFKTIAFFSSISFIFVSIFILSLFFLKKRRYNDKRNGGTKSVISYMKSAENVSNEPFYDFFTHEFVR